MTEAQAWADQEAAGLAEVPDLAVLVEDRLGGKEHLEFEKVCTSCLFGVASGSGFMD